MSRQVFRRTQRSLPSKLGCMILRRGYSGRLIVPAVVIGVGWFVMKARAVAAAVSLARDIRLVLEPGGGGRLAAFAAFRHGAADAVILGFGPESGGFEAFRGKTPFQQLAHGGCPARHAGLVPKVVQNDEFFRGEHDLQPLASASSGRQSHLQRGESEMSKVLIVSRRRNGPTPRIRP